MKKTSLEILSEIRSELQELMKKAGELDGRLSSLLETEAATEPVAVTGEEIGAVEPDAVDLDAGVEIASGDSSGQGFDIMMDDDIDFVVSDGKPVAAAEVKTPKEAEAKPKEKANPAHVKKAKKMPAEPDQSRVYAWKTSVPASPLSNILSGISLKERGMLISTLFNDDAQLFIDTVRAFNAMKSLNEAESYIISRFPNWKLDSDNVFRLMMAVRRKLN